MPIEKNNPASCQTAVSGSITLSKRNDRHNAVQLNTKSNFFSSEIIVKYTNKKLTFGKPTFDYNGKTIKPNKMKDGRYQCTIHGKDLPIGKFDFDEDESTEDCIVLYCH